MDAIELLEKQHREVKQLFQKLEAADKEDPRAIRRGFAQLADALVAHGEIEEQFFYPAVKVKPLEGVVRRFAGEHYEMKQLVACLLDATPLASPFFVALGQLKDAVLGHLAEEEREMFPAVRKMFTADELQWMGEELQDRYEEIIGGAPRFDVRYELNAPAEI